MAQKSARLTSLDGLRGVAALVVVVFHVAISDRAVGSIWQAGQQPRLGVIGYLFTYTPLRILWAGSEAVVVFFVLSGLVLALPFTAGRGPAWKLFYPRRLVRLYLPAMASLVFAWVTTLLVTRRPVGEGSPWLNSHALEPHGLVQVIRGATLLGGWGGLNASLWSLRFEVAFSLLLPAFLVFGRLWPRLAALKVVLLTGICIGWPLFGFFSPDAVYLVVFAFGVLIAFHLDALRRLASTLTRLRWIAIAVLGVVLLTNSWLVAGIDLTSRLRAVWIGIAALGASLLVFTAAFCPGARRLLDVAPVRWLGRISFSLYLVQEPVVVGFEYLTGARLPLLVTLPVAVALALVFGWLFYLGVERPAHRLAQSIGSAKPVDRATEPTSVAAHHAGTRFIGVE